MIIIADIAGEYNALMRLVNRFSSDEEFILVGDLVDRGPKSKEVIEWAMSNPNVKAVLGNHEHFFIDSYKRLFDPEYEHVYDAGLWFQNGGLATLRSYGGDTTHQALYNVPDKHIAWLEKLPTYIEFINPFHDMSIHISHAPYLWDKDVSKFDKIWNRKEPTYQEGMIQIFGHNSYWGLKRFEKDGKLWAICIDQSGKRVLTGYNPYTDEVFEEPYEVKE